MIKNMEDGENMQFVKAHVAKHVGLGYISRALKVYEQFLKSIRLPNTWVSYILSAGVCPAQIRLTKYQYNQEMGSGLCFLALLLE